MDLLNQTGLKIIYKHVHLNPNPGGSCLYGSLQYLKLLNPTKSKLPSITKGIEEGADSPIIIAEGTDGDKVYLLFNFPY